MPSDFQSWITILSLVVTLTSLLVAVYAIRKSEPTRKIAKIRLNKELAKARLFGIADTLRTWDNEMQMAELKNEKFDLSKSKVRYGGLKGPAIALLAREFTQAYYTYPNFVTSPFMDLILKDVTDENGRIVSLGTFFDNRQNVLLAIREIDQIIGTF
jgi:hypothetical protein